MEIIEDGEICGVDGNHGKSENLANKSKCWPKQCDLNVERKDLSKDQQQQSKNNH